VRPGERAPDFTLPTVPDEGFVSLADYRGRSPLLLMLLRDLCRRLRDLGLEVETRPVAA
jgi:peroxiredoxin